MGKTNTIVLKANQYYDKDFLPAGIVLKKNTGIGATEHELYKSKRNSIVISLLLSIQESKRHQNVLTISGNFFNAPNWEQRVADYMEFGPDHKKIHITVESFRKLSKALSSLGIDVYKEFHYLLDEAHMIQTEASYRKILPVAFDHYKKFPKSARTILSATLYPFSDPELQKENTTEIVRDETSKLEFDLHLTNDPVRMLGQVISLLQDQGQILIFVNSIGFALKAIDTFKLQSAVIYCGQGNKDGAGIYFRDFDSNPTDEICFYTSAYFTGCDIYSSGTQVIVAGESGSKQFKLTESEIVQALGRVRNSTTKKVMITTLNNLEFTKLARFNAKAAIGKTNAKVKRINKLLDNPATRNRGIMEIKFLDSMATSFVRMTLDKRATVNYSLIDSYEIKDSDYRKLYDGKDSMKSFLEKISKVYFKESIYAGPLLALKSRGRKSKIAEFNSALAKIIDYEGNYLIEKLSSGSTTSFDYGLFAKIVLRNSKGIERNYLNAYQRSPDLDAFKKCGGDLKQYNALRIKSHIDHSLDWEISNAIDNELPIASRIKIKDLIPIINRLLKLFGMSNKITNRSATKYLQYFRNYKRVRIGKGKAAGVEILP